MSVLENSAISCGVRQLHSLSDGAKEAVAHVAHTMGSDHDRYSVVVFSDQVLSQRGGSNGEKLAAFIRRNRLGKLSATSEVINRNTENVIKVWTWVPDIRKITKYKADGDRLRDRDGHVVPESRVDELEGMYGHSTWAEGWGADDYDGRYL